MCVCTYAHVLISSHLGLRFWYGPLYFLTTFCMHYSLPHKCLSPYPFHRVVHPRCVRVRAHVHTHTFTCNSNNNNFTQTHLNCNISHGYQLQIQQEIITVSYKACSSGLLSSSAMLDLLDAGKGIMSFTHAPLILLP